MLNTKKALARHDQEIIQSLYTFMAGCVPAMTQCATENLGLTPEQIDNVTLRFFAQFYARTMIVLKDATADRAKRDISSLPIPENIQALADKRGVVLTP